jgi:hypothetical protein
VLAEFNRAEPFARAQYRSFLEARINLKDPLAEFQRCTATGSEAFQKTVKSKIRPMGIYLMNKHCPIDLKSASVYWRIDYAAASISAKRFE